MLSINPANILDACLREAGPDIEAGLRAAEFIVANLPNLGAILSVDTSGHEHKGKGEGGGQFTKGGGGSPAPTKKKKLSQGEKYALNKQEDGKRLAGMLKSNGLNIDPSRLTTPYGGVQFHEIRDKESPNTLAMFSPITGGIEINQHPSISEQEMLSAVVHELSHAMDEKLGGGIGSGTVTSVSFTNGAGIVGTVANPTTTPTLSLTLGAITPTTVNGLTITTSTGTLTIANGKTLTASNTLTLTATDGSTLAIGTGGTLGTAAYITLGANVGTWLTTPSSANLAAALTDETGSGAAVFANTPTLVTPILGTPTSGTLTNCTMPVGGISGLGANVATFLATPSSANMAAAVTDETGSGALVFANTPSLTTPNIGLATASTLIVPDTNGAYIKSPGMTVVNLPGTPVAGMRAYVTDSNAASYTAGIGAIVAAGGTTVVPVFYDGTSWRIG